MDEEIKEVKEVEEVEEVKKERPQNKNLKPLGRGNLTPEEELAIRRKGKEASVIARRRNADIRAAVRAMLNLNSKGRAKSKDVLRMISTEEIQEDGAPMIARLVYAQLLLALDGDKEARDWICKMAGVESFVPESVNGLTVTADADAMAGAGGVRIHLIRGEKPQTEESPEDAATRAADRMAVVEAMRAIGEAVAEGQVGAETVSEGE